MSRRYTAHEKANALVHLQMNGGDISATSRQFDIPERTLFDWRRDWYAKNPPPQPSPPRLQQSDFENDLQALAYLRKQIMSELIELAGSYQTGTMFASPTQRIHLLSQLLDRLMKLDAHLKPYKPYKMPRFRIGGDTGLYLRTDQGYRGPYLPAELPVNWQDKYGPSTRLELYWVDGTFTPLPDEIHDLILSVRDFSTEPCELLPPLDDEDDFDRAYG